MADLEMMDLVATVPGTIAEIEVQDRPNGQEVSVIFRTPHASTTVLRISRLSKVIVIGKGHEDADSEDV